MTANCQWRFTLHYQRVCFRDVLEKISNKPLVCVVMLRPAEISACYTAPAPLTKMYVRRCERGRKICGGGRTWTPKCPRLRFTGGYSPPLTVTMRIIRVE